MGTMLLERQSGSTHSRNMMHPALLVALSMIVPFACLGLLLFLSWLEDTLDDGVKKAERRYVPEPIRAVPQPRSRPASAGDPSRPRAVASGNTARQPDAAVTVVTP
jgi:hypothetical protein